MIRASGLGARLRRLIGHLDDAVEQLYADAGLAFRPRFYPYFDLLLDRGEVSVGEFASALGFTQPAVTQTLQAMRAAGLIAPVATADRRQRRYALTAAAHAMVPALERIWDAVHAAAERLDRSLEVPLGPAVDAALARLEHEPFTTLLAKEMTR